MLHKTDPTSSKNEEEDYKFFIKCEAENVRNVYTKDRGVEEIHLRLRIEGREGTKDAKLRLRRVGKLRMYF